MSENEMRRNASEWLEDLNSDDSARRAEATRALAFMGELAVPHLIMALRQNTIRFDALAETLSQIGRTAVDPLGDLLNEDDTALQVRVAQVLGRVGDNRAVIPLIVAVNSTDITVRSAAASALGNFTDMRAVGPLLKTLHDTDHQVRAAAAQALGNYHADDRVAGALLEMLNDPDLEVRKGVIVALANFDDEAVSQALNQALYDTNSDIRQLAAAALQELHGDKLALERLEALKKSDRGEFEEIIDRVDEGTSQIVDELYNSNPRIRARLLEVMGDRGGEYAVSVIIPGLNDINPAVRVTAIDSLRRIGSAAVMPLIAALDEKSRYIRMGVIEALGLIADDRALDALIHLTEDPDPQIRLKTVEALAKFKNPRSIKALQQAYLYASEIEKAVIVVALEMLGEQAPADNMLNKLRRWFGR